MSDAAFWNKLAPKYAAQPIADPAAYEETLTRVRSYLKDSDKMLEIGCGTGGSALKQAPSVSHYTATDISREMIAIALGKLGPGAPENVEFLCCDSETEIPGAPFDAVFASSILHLVPDLGTTLRQLHAQLKPGGVLISKTPCIGEMSFFVKLLIPLMQAFGKAPNVLRFKSAELEAAIGKAGFEIVETGYFGKDRAAHFVVAHRVG